MTSCAGLQAMQKLVDGQRDRHYTRGVPTANAATIRPIPAEPAEEVFALHITPSNATARDRIVAGTEDPEQLRATFDQARDLARDLDASIVLLHANGTRAGRIERDGGYVLERRD